MEWVVWSVAGVILVFGWVVIRGAPYVPSHRRFVRQSFKELYPVSSTDTLVDLGSGDGVVLREASACGAQAIGCEINPLLVLMTRLLSWGDRRVTVKTADYWRVDLPKETTIVYIFAVTRDIKKVEKHMQRWADTCQHDLYLMTYGTKLKGKKPIRELNAHALYVFAPTPLQRQ